MRNISLCAFIISALLLSLAAVVNAQAAPDDPTDPQKTQNRGYWVDPETHLMWASRDNGKNINWHQAVKYCRKSNVAQFSDWRLADIDELWGIFERGKLPERRSPT